VLERGVVTGVDFLTTVVTTQVVEPFDETAKVAFFFLPQLRCLCLPKLQGTRGARAGAASADGGLDGLSNSKACPL
jgi:hypothetical protein